MTPEIYYALADSVLLAAALYLAMRMLPPEDRGELREGWMSERWRREQERAA